MSARSKRRRRPAEHFVYLIRDSTGKCRYFGYGRHPSRATGRHNDALDRFVSRGRYTIEHAGPYFSREMGMKVETALISAVRPEFNQREGSGKWQFRPLDVPQEFADRLSQDPLGRDDLIERCAAEHLAPALLVCISAKKLSDGRPGWSAIKPLSDSQLLARMNRWWMLGRYYPRWLQDPETSPGVLIGLAGRPSARFIIGAVRIDRNNWRTAKYDGAFNRVSTMGPADLDALGLRGCRISPSAHIEFGPVPSRFYCLLPARNRSR